MRPSSQQQQPSQQQPQQSQSQQPQPQPQQPHPPHHHQSPHSAHSTFPFQPLHSNPQNEIFQISQTKQTIIIKIRLPQNIIARNRENQNLRRFFNDMKSFMDRGKYRELKLGFLSESKSLLVFITKKYYLKLLGYKKYEVLVFSRAFLSVLDQFWASVAHMMTTRMIRSKQCRIVKNDIISITLSRDLITINSQNKPQGKRIYLKISPLQFRRNGYVRLKECQQYFSIVVRNNVNTDSNANETININNQIYQVQQQQDDILQDVPQDEQFYSSPRISFIDDMYSNQSFNKRFISRFYTFYQAYNLINGKMKVQNQHKFIKQFYQKCVARVSMSAMRLKKMAFHFKMPYIDKQKSNNFDKQKLRFSFHLICCEDEIFVQNMNLLPPFNPQTYPYYHPIGVQPDPRKQGVYFYMQLLNENLQSIQKQHQNATNANMIQQFYKHFLQSINPQKNPYLSHQGTNQTQNKDPSFIESIINGSWKCIRIINQVGYARLLCQLSFFMDRYIFRTMGSKLLSETQNSGNLRDQIMYYKLPLGQEYKHSKYSYNYCLEVRSSYNYISSTNTGINLVDQQRPYENVMSKVIMVRRRTANMSGVNNSGDNLEYGPGFEPMKGLAVYVNEMLKKWNASDVYHDINNFISGYMNVIADKNKQAKDKNLFKSLGNWKIIVDGLSALVQALTRSFCTQDTTILLYILNTYKQKPLEQLSKGQPQEGQQIMTMTFKFMRLTCVGWYQVIPSCLYYFQMGKDQTVLYMPGEAKEEFNLKSKKENIEKMFKAYILRTLKRKIQLPQFYYNS